MPNNSRVVGNEIRKGWAAAPDTMKLGNPRSAVSLPLDPYGGDLMRLVSESRELPGPYDISLPAPPDLVAIVQQMLARNRAAEQQAYQPEDPQIAENTMHTVDKLMPLMRAVRGGK